MLVLLSEFECFGGVCVENFLFHVEHFDGGLRAQKARV
jgi:hypothetical protein